MHPPAWVCRELAHIHPQARLAWLGKPAKGDDDLNAGTFCVVQLYHRRDAGTPDEPKTMRDFWFVEPEVDPITRELYHRTVDRGPIFSKTGRPNHMDWDPLQRVPMTAAMVDPEDVFSGKFLHALRTQLRKHAEFKARIREEKLERGRNMNLQRDELRETFADALHYQESRRDNAINIAKEHMKVAPKPETDFTEFFLNRA